MFTKQVSGPLDRVHSPSWPSDTVVEDHVVLVPHIAGGHLPRGLLLAVPTQERDDQVAQSMQPDSRALTWSPHGRLGPPLTKCYDYEKVPGQGGWS
jgi:hypothetical protein